MGVKMGLCSLQIPDWFASCKDCLVPHLLQYSCTSPLNIESSEEDLQQNPATHDPALKNQNHGVRSVRCLLVTLIACTASTLAAREF